MGLSDWWGGGNARGDGGEARGASKGILSWLRRFGGWPGPALANKSAVAAKLAAEKANAGPPGIFIPRFLPYLDETTGETAQHRWAYRHMLADPNVKSALLGKILGVGRLTLNVKPADKGDPNDQEVARFVEWVLTRRLEGGIPGLAWSVLSGGLVDGYSVCEKVFARETFGRHAGKWPLSRLKPIMTGDDVVLETDQHLNVVGILGLRYNGGKHFSPADFLIYRHLPMYNSPTGMSDLRAAYEPWWMLKNARWLRAQAVEKRAVGFLLGKFADPSQQRALEDVLARAKSHNWGICPKDVEVELLDLAGSSDAIFDGFERSKKHDIFLAIRHAVLQNVEGNITDGRGNSQVHQSEAQTATLYLAATLEALLNDRECGLVKDIVDLNYTVSDYPHAILSAVDVNELKSQAEVDKALLEAGLDLSKEELYERYDRTPPESGEDTLKKAAPAPGPGFPPGAPPGKGGPGFPPGGNQPQPGEAGPPRPPEDEGGGGDAEPFAEFDASKHPRGQPENAGQFGPGTGATDHERTAHAHLAANPRGEGHTRAEVAERTGLSHEDARAALRGLERAGHIDWTSETGRGTVYHARTPATDAARAEHRQAALRHAIALTGASTERPDLPDFRNPERLRAEGLAQKAAADLGRGADALSFTPDGQTQVWAGGALRGVIEESDEGGQAVHGAKKVTVHADDPPELAEHKVRKALGAWVPPSLRRKVKALKDGGGGATAHAEFDPAKHPRGHEGNPGQFGPGGGRKRKPRAAYEPERAAASAPGASSGGRLPDDSKQVLRVEANPYNFILYSTPDGAGEIRASTSGRFHDMPLDPKVLEEARERLGLPAGWKQGDPILGRRHKAQGSSSAAPAVPATPAQLSPPMQRLRDYAASLSAGQKPNAVAAARAILGREPAGMAEVGAAHAEIRKAGFRDVSDAVAALRTPPAPGAPPPEHLAAVAKAFHAHPGSAGNLVPLHGLHKGSGLDLPQLHAAVNHLRKQGVLSGVGAEGRHGVTGEERAAMIPEEGGHAVGHVAARDRARLDELAR